MSRNYVVSTKIDKPVSEVFAAVVSRDLLSKYFCETATSDLEVGQVVTWRWDGWGDHPVRVDVVEKNRRIELVINSQAWKKTSADSYDVRITFNFEAAEDGGTVLSISEAGWKTDPDGLKASHENCGGWMHMATCLKAWLEHGIDLR